MLTNLRCRCRRAALATLMLTTASLACAQPPGHSPGPWPTGGSIAASAQKVSRLGPTDTSFLMRAAESGLYETAAGKLAASRGHHEQVRAFGEKLARDHAATNGRLAVLARDHGVMLPGVIPAKEEIVLERLRKLSGTEFDRQFIQTVGIDAHREAIALFQKAVSSVQAEPVRAFAKEALPELQAHLAQGERLALLTSKLAGGQSSTTTLP